MTQNKMVWSDTENSKTMGKSWKEIKRRGCGMKEETGDLFIYSSV